MKLGVKAKDKITGFTGIVTGKCSYLTGCDQYLVAPKSKGNNKDESHWFDEARLKVIGKGIKPEDVTTKEDPGGPGRDAPKK